MASDERIVYRIKGMYWQQECLTYDQWLAIRELLRGKTATFDIVPASFATWIDAMIAEGILPKMVGIVLKPYEPTPWHRIVNKLMARRHGITRDNLGALITSSPRFANVVRDFFLLNIVWWQSWLGTPMDSGTIQIPKMTPLAIMQALLNTVGMLAAATLPKRPPSA